MKHILGRKKEMTQFFDEQGLAHAATIVEAGPITVLAIKTVESDGYDALVLGYGSAKEKNVSRAQARAWGKLGVFAVVRELRLEAPAEGVSVGDVLDAGVFDAGDRVSVAGISKGKGFQGVVKRHGFSGGPRTHGQKHTERAPGSIGSTGPQRVFKGTRMAGRMGTDRVTVKNLHVLAVDVKNNLLLVRGALPGRRGTLLEITAK